MLRIFQGFRPIALRAAIVGGSLALLSLYFGIWSPAWLTIGWRELIIAGWVIGPPLYFWAEWTWGTGGLTRQEIEDLKHGQEVGRNIWFALVILLAALYGVSPSLERNRAAAPEPPEVLNAR